MTLDELTAAFTLEGVNRANAVVNFKESDPFDPKAVWLNGGALRALPSMSYARDLQPFFEKAGLQASPEKLHAVTPLIRERIQASERGAPAAANFFFVKGLAPYDPAELIPQKGDVAMARRVLEPRRRLWPRLFDHDSLDKALRATARPWG